MRSGDILRSIAMRGAAAIVLWQTSQWARKAFAPAISVPRTTGACAWPAGWSCARPPVAKPSRTDIHINPFILPKPPRVRGRHSMECYGADASLLAAILLEAPDRG